MIRAFLKDWRGAAAIEFALVVPVFLAFVFGGAVMGLAVWQRNILQNVAVDAARCVALGATACTTVAAGCGGAAGACFAVQRAKDRGLPRLLTSQVSVDPTNMNGTTFTTVVVRYPFNVAGYGMTLVASASFPNGG